MLVRIVKMIFEEEKIADFKSFFEQHKNSIRNFEGCQFLALYQDKKHPEIFFTYSHWENEDALENYRHSELFKKVWPETKQLFGGKPEAWSVDKIVSLP